MAQDGGENKKRSWRLSESGRMTKRGILSDKILLAKKLEERLTELKVADMCVCGPRTMDSLTRVLVDLNGRIDKCCLIWIKAE